MLNKKTIISILIIFVSLLFVSAISATENITDDTVSVEQPNDELIEIEDEGAITEEHNRDFSTNIDEIEDNRDCDENDNILSTDMNKDTLEASPSANKYSVRVSDTTLTYGKSGTIYMSITPYTDGYSSDYKYDFYLKVYDSNGNEKINKRYYSSLITYGESYTVDSKSLSTGIYTIKIVNYNDRSTMSTAKLTVLSVPQSAYSVKVSDTTLSYGVPGFIEMAITPASSDYYYKYDFYLKVYDSNGNEKISQKYYSTSSDYSKTYSVGSYMLNTGVYTIKLLNDINNYVMSTAKLTVLSVPSYAYSVNVYDTTINYGSRGNLEMSITPASDKFYYKYDFYLKVYNSNGIEKINKRYYGAGSDYSKTYTIDSASLGIGVYTIKILNNIDNSLMSNAKLSIIKTDLETQDVTGNCNEIIEFKVRAAENNKFTSGLNITVICNDEEYHISTDDDGYASLNIHLKANTYNVRTIFKDNINENQIIVNPVYVENTYKDVYVKSFTGQYNGKNRVNYGWKGNLEGYLKIYKGNKLINQIKFNSNGNIYDYFTYTNHDKQYTVNAIKNAGKYNAIITDIHGIVLAKSTITIKKATPKFSILKKTFDIKLKTKQIKITLKDNAGGIKKAKLTLKIKGKVYKAKTNSKGIATFKIKKLTKKGSYKVNAKFKGNANYNKASKNFKINVKKIKKSPSKKKTSSTKKKTTTNKKSSEIYKFNVPHAEAQVNVKVYTGNSYNTYLTQTNWLGNGEVRVTETTGTLHKVLLEVYYYDNGFKRTTYEGASFFLR